MRLFDFDPDTGTTTWYKYDHDAKKVTLYKEQDVGRYIEQNKRLSSDVDRSKKGIKESWWHAATIPNVVISKWLHTHGVNVYNKHHWPKVQKLLNDPEWRYLRTSHGKV